MDSENVQTLETQEDEEQRIVGKVKQNQIMPLKNKIINFDTEQYHSPNGSIQALDIQNFKKEQENNNSVNINDQNDIMVDDQSQKLQTTSRYEQQKKQQQNNFKIERVQTNQNNNNIDKKGVFFKSKVKFIFLMLNAFIPVFMFVGTQIIFNTMANHAPAILGWKDDEIPLYMALITSLNSFGALVGSSVAGKYAVKGRRFTLMIYNVIFILGTFLTITGSTVLLLIGRILQGFSNGSTYVVGIVYIIEFTPDNIKSIIGAGFGFFPGMGLFTALALGIGLPKDEEEDNNQYWRFMLSFFAILSFINLILLKFVFKKDTPQFQIQTQMQKIKEEKTCVQEIQELNTNNQQNIAHESNEKQQMDQKQQHKIQNLKDIKFYNSIFTEFYLDQLQQNIQKEINNQQQQVTFKELFSKKYIKQTFLGCLIQTLHVLSCANVVNAYSTLIIQEQESKDIAIIFTLLIALGDFMGTITSFFILPKFGRKTVLGVGYILIVTSISLLPILDFLDLGKGQKFVLIFMKFSYASFIPGTLVVATQEILPDIGIGLTQSCFWFWNIFAYFFFPILAFNTALELNFTFILFASICYILIFVFMKYYKETKGKSQLEVAKLF